jgi:fluoroquinolone transport system permease protein
MVFGDIRFQWKYGFYFIYFIITIAYICLLSAFPDSWKNTAAGIMIFSDPAAMGLFFMGAIVLMEKNERILNALAISPVKKSEYILSKVIALAFISTVVALVLAVVAQFPNIPMALLGTVITSIMFTLIGIIIATKIQSMNQYFMVIAPVDMLLFVPPILGEFMELPAILRFYPPNAAFAIITNTGNLSFNLAVSGVGIVLLYIVTYRCVSKIWSSVGGVKI